MRPTVDALVEQALQQAGALGSMLRFVTTAHHILASRFITLHKATAKLCYVATALLAGVLEQGFCTAPEAGEEGPQEGEGGSFKEAQGTVSVWLNATIFGLLGSHAVSLSVNLHQRKKSAGVTIVSFSKAHFTL